MTSNLDPSSASKPTFSLCGLLNLNKPSGITSRAVVDRVQRPLNRRVKVGHAGTLDPLASGVLVVCVGAATRLIEYVQRQSKTYQTTVLLGARSDTHDADGLITPQEGAVPPSLQAIHDALATQVGVILQKPPEYSALKVAGRRAYDLARAGVAVDLAPRPITIHRIDVLNYHWPRVELEVECEGGTYIRSIARDLGDIISCGGLVEVLVRTRIGAFALVDAIDPEILSLASIPELLRPALDAVSQLPSVRISTAQLDDVARGRAISLEDAPEGEVALLGPDGLLAAVGQSDASTGRISPKRVLMGIG